MKFPLKEKSLLRIFLIKLRFYNKKNTCYVILHTHLMLNSQEFGSHNKIFTGGSAIKYSSNKISSMEIKILIWKFILQTLLRKIIQSYYVTFKQNSHST